VARSDVTRTLGSVDWEGMRARLCDCDAPEPYSVVSADGQTAALVCKVCSRPMEDRRQHPQGVLEAATEAGFDRVLVSADSVTTALVHGDVAYSVRVDAVVAALRDALDARVLSDGGEVDERVLRSA
jgi:hypothetical protein